jgi:hypothetical protein
MSDNDGYDLNENGTITFEFEGITRVLKRPTLGQYRGVIDALGTLRDDVVAAQKEGTDLKPGQQLDLLIVWLDHVLVTLAGEGLPRTADGVFDEDRIPAWLLSGTVVTDVIGHWQTVPSRHGGR